MSFLRAHLLERYRLSMSASTSRAIVSVIAGVFVTCASALHWLAPVELPARDVLLRALPERAARHVAVVAIDEESLEREGAWPWHRGRLADLVDRIAGSEASVLGIDVLLNDPRAGDPELAAACRRIQCVAATTLDERGRWILPAAALRGDLAPAHAAFELDEDGVLRWISSTKQDRSASYPAFSAELARLSTGNPITAGVALIPGFRTPPRSVPVVSATAVLRGDRGALAALQGRTVVLGITAVALGDRVMTPRSRRHQTDPGVLVHGAAVESFLTRDTFRELSPLAAGVLAASLVWLAVRTSRTPNPRLRLACGTALILTPVAMATGLVFAHTLSPVVAPTGVLASAVLAAESRRVLHLMRHGRAAVATLANDLGAPTHIGADVGERLEVLAAAIVRRRARDQESKRVLVHELKTPLSAMDSLSQLLTEFDLTSSERHRVASLLGDETKKLQEMISRLLEIERVALRGRVDSLATIDLGELTSSRTAFLSRGVARSIGLSSEPNIFVPGDPALVERIIDNLVGNAAKYSAEGSPVDVSIRRDSGAALLEVSDRGPGIPLAERSRIFGSFERGTSAAGTEGFGLGLALVFEAVRWHGGSVDVTDREGGGSIFRVRFPTAEAPAREAV